MAEGVFFGGLIHQGRVMTIIKVLELYALNDLSSRPVWATQIKFPAILGLYRKTLSSHSPIFQRETERGEKQSRVKIALTTKMRQ